MKKIIGPAFCSLCIIVATLLLSSCNTDEQKVDANATILINDTLYSPRGWNSDTGWWHNKHGTYSIYTNNPHTEFGYLNKISEQLEEVIKLLKRLQVTKKQYE